MKKWGFLRWFCFPISLACGLTLLSLDGQAAEESAPRRPRVFRPEPGEFAAVSGKVVVLDFWATWCGPCQGPMADLQKLKETHTNWAEKVAIVPLSIDDTLGTVRQHVNKRGWTNTFNVWAGEGGWRSGPAKAFRVSGVPTTYIIDAKGTIVDAGHPAGMRLEDRVEKALH